MCEPRTVGSMHLIRSSGRNLQIGSAAVAGREQKFPEDARVGARTASTASSKDPT